MMCSQLLSGQISEAEKSALISFYQQTGGADWIIPWNLNDAPDRWYGVQISKNTVTALRLNGNGLKGDIPSTLASLANLRELDLGSNNLSGEVPAVIGSLTNLNKLDLSNNALSGNLSSSLPMHLEDLALGDNRFDSVDVAGFLNFQTKLKHLDLRGFKLSEIPAAVSSLSGLESLDLGDNQITNDVSALAGLTNLRRLSLSNNRLTAVPQELPASLTDLDLSKNPLSDYSNLRRLARLETLNLSGNNLQQIPGEISALTGLFHLDLSVNALSGNLSALGNLQRLQQLYLHNNRFTAFPAELQSIKSLAILTLYSNQLSGSIPMQLPTVTDLRNNRYSLADIERFFVNSQQSPELYYSPQRYDVAGSATVPEGEAFTLNQSLSSLAGYQFRWYRDYDQFTGSTAEKLSFNKLKKEDFGTYTCEAFIRRRTLGYEIELSLFREPFDLYNALGTKDTTAEERMYIYPNPAAERATIFSLRDKVLEYTLYDMSGKILMHKRNTIEINTSNLTPALYLLQVKTAAGMRSFKLIKK